MNYSNLESEITTFLESLNIEKYNYKPSLNGNTLAGEKISLGFMCYATKILYTINSDKLSDETFKEELINYFKSFNQTKIGFPENSFIDNNYFKEYKKNYPALIIKNTIKYILGRIPFRQIHPNHKLKEFIRAESKQTLATLGQINYSYDVYNQGYPNTKLELKEFCKNLDWSLPWNAGAQLSAVATFNAISGNSEEIRNVVDDILISLLKNDGTYYEGPDVGTSEKINGAMKVITGMDWLNIKIHKPQNLIDTCLEHIPSSEGCDIVDVIYVLYKCHQITDYKSAEIEEYLQNLLPKIMEHYYPEYGGFSYFIHKSQTHYYGVKVTEGLNSPDIHGTTLLVWALSMIFEILGNDYPNWSVIKP